MTTKEATKGSSIPDQDITTNVYPAGDWALSPQKQDRLLVGNNNQILWAKGETLLVCADSGSGKSTFSQNIVRTSIGLIPDLLGLFAKQFKATLYIAADRPYQVQESLKRMVDESNRELWNKYMYVKEGYLDFMVNETPERLYPYVRELAEKLDREPFDSVIIDSLKDIVSEYDDNTPGVKINRAFQSLVQNDIQLLVNVHPRKMQDSKGREKDPVLDDVGGNKNVVNGAGSVIYIGAPDNEYQIQELIHLKSPSEKIRGMKFTHDISTGNLSPVTY